MVSVLLLLAACDQLGEWERKEDDTSTDVIYTEDWKYVTIYLDGELAPISPNVKAPARAAHARAMTPDTARLGYNFFEVVFYSSTGVLARASWEVGRRASIKNVYRTASGVSYSHTGANRAVLFAGYIEDQTLLAVGIIDSVDGVPGTTITTESVFVTFKLHALTAGVSPVYEINPNFNPEEENYDIYKSITPDPLASSFVTSALTPSLPPSGTNTQVMKAQIGTRFFPLYKLPGGVTGINASYKFELDETGWDEYAPNIKVALKGDARKREVRFPAGDGSGRYWYAVYPEDLTTHVAMTNNGTVGSTIENPVTFSFDTSNTVNPDTYYNGIFTLVFEVPVYAYSDAPCAEGNEAVIWNIRPAYSTYLYNMDNGITSYGGAILIGVNMKTQDLEISVKWG